MTSPARRHFQRKVAAKAAGREPVPAAIQRQRADPQATEYEHQRAALGVDLRRLKNIQSLEAKLELKADLIAAYDPWVEGVIEAAKGPDGNFERGKGVADDILITTMIWAIDIGDHARAIPRAEYALRYDLPMPSRFERTLGCFVAEAFAETALAAHGRGEAIDLDVLLQVEALTEDEDMPDEVRAKLHKAIGFAISARAAAAQQEGSTEGPAGGARAANEAALKHQRRALELNDKAGVKKEIERLEREQKKLAEAEQE
ncbi:phage terminase small subunit [Novosphingopyxis sp. YJ-S2-01]|uniref:phage terminase small subunit n=1 Tax=Novosphingopyxis sp. YJ-S2-01 TaxID=2794021 RepID=UPI0018DB9E7B|nr:phage terminase small subunit [Novosphingopyxis sp. YJ-S2-01]MBH9536937.1 terminase [Novosphingopyxis sp. YJ-S2-01]